MNFPLMELHEVEIYRSKSGQVSMRHKGMWPMLGMRWEVSPRGSVAEVFLRCGYGL